MKVAIAQHVTSFEALDRQLAFETISDDPENYHRCVARERTLELAACQEAGVPCFLILDTHNTQRIYMAGNGAQNTLREHLLYDADRQQVESLAGYEVLARASVGYEQSVLQFIKAKGGVNIADWASQQRTQEWYKHVRPEFLKRHLGWFRMHEALLHSLTDFRDAEGRLFAKTSYKGLAGVTDSLIGLLGYETELAPRSAEVVVSEPLTILTDERGKREYRCFVVRSRVSSISRYIDYDTDYPIPVEIERLAAAFTEAHIEVMPDCYVVDVAESDRGPVVVEMNAIVASGRYERNDFRKLLADLAV